ncbi:MAG: hypothetical protein E6Z86_09095, partial [Clostridium butyricum]|nr:hypothetical protein [Clostridium butyricum]
MFKDKSGIFEDFGFKLVVINSLLEKETSFSNKLEEMNEKYVAVYEGDGFECIPEMVEFFENLNLTKEDLALVKELCFDGGEEIYFMIMPEYDGESDEFDVKSIGGFEKLPNLRQVEYIAMCSEELIDEFKEKGIEITEALHV